jgi:hypothetical protein
MNGDDYISATAKNGIAGLGQEFDGSNDYIRFVEPSNFGLDTSFTMAVWAYNLWSFWPSWAHMWGDWTGMPAAEFAIREGRVYIGVREKLSSGDGSDYLWGNMLLTQNSWNYIVASFSHGTFKVYANGCRDAVKTSALHNVNNSGNNKFIGAKNAAGDFPFRGYLDEFRLSTVARSDAWVKLEYENQRPAQTLISLEDTIQPPESGEDLSSWQYSTKIILNTLPSGANISSNIYNFQVLVRLNPSNFSCFNSTLPGGADIRFSKANGSVLPYQIERWVDASNNNDSAEIWIKVDTIYGSNSSQYFIMHWGKPTAIDKSNPALVFDTASGFSAVWHLGEEHAGTGAAGVYKDATSNQNSGKDYLSTSDCAGIIGNGNYFNGANDYIKIPSSTSLNQYNKNSTVSMWIKTSSVYQYERMLFEHDVWGNPGTYQVTTFDASTLRWNFVNAGTALDYNRSFNDGAWHNVAATFDTAGKVQRIFYDGTERVNGVASGKIGSSYGESFIGCRGGTTMFFPGYIDELRVSRIAQNGSWIKLCYENQKLNQSLVSVLPGPEDFSTWPNTMNIHLNTTSSGANATNNVFNFPLLIRLNPSVFSGFANTLPGGADIRFSKPDGTALPYQIERWVDAANNADTAEIWIKADTLFGNNSSQYIMMYWGKTGISSTSDGATVFGTSNGFAGVWHMNSNPGGTAPQILDATGNALNASSRGSMTSSNMVAGMVGKAISFDGINDYITMGNGPKVDITGNSDMTISAWARLSVLNDWNAIAGKGDHQYLVQFRPSPVHDEFCIYDGANWQPAYNLSKPSITAGTWYFVTGTYNHLNQTLYLYRNGKQIASQSAAQISSLRDDSLCVGVNSEYWSRYFNGIIDEFRLENTTRSADWIKLEYQNQKADQTLVVY